MAHSKEENKKKQISNNQLNRSTEIKSLARKNISLDEMPVLSPKTDFESLIIEKLQHDKPQLKQTTLSDKNISTVPTKRPYLKRGEGMARFGLNKNALIIQNTKSLPWRCKTIKPNKMIIIKETNVPKNHEENIDVQIITAELNPTRAVKNGIEHSAPELATKVPKITNSQDKTKQESNISVADNCEVNLNGDTEKPIDHPKGKHPLPNKGQTWATILTKEQTDFLHHLKQSDYYKNFNSPTKSTVSDHSCDENLSKFRQEREIAEQKMFELLEKKVANESFNIENSFFNTFLKKNRHEYSGESTPLMMQKCLSSNSNLLHILPNFKHKTSIDHTQGEVESCASDYTEYCSDTCSSVSSCCSCKTIAQDVNSNYSNKECSENIKNLNEPKRTNVGNRLKAENVIEKTKSQDNNVIDNEVMKTNMFEMNTKLITTSELLKERLCELEDEIETFKKENANLIKLREEVDLDRQKFYEEKKVYEQKLNEEKILSEYYLAEEKEKLMKQKQTYERYVREMRGRLNKKEKDEVTSLKKEIERLKEEVRIKDAKSTSTIARLRNQIKIMEKEKKDFSVEVEKLKKENRRIQHSNDITRRLTNMKYLAEINKKLTKMTCDDKRSEVNIGTDSKYRSFEIERQSSSKKLQATVKKTIRPRAKSVPNINVTSTYARYFSQRDSTSQIEDKKPTEVDCLDRHTSYNEESDFENDDKISHCNNWEHDNVTSDIDNNLEKLYIETFKSASSKSSLSSINSCTNQIDKLSRSDDYFLQRDNSNSRSVRVNKSPTQRLRTSKSPVLKLNGRPNSPSSCNSHDSTEFVANLSGGSNNSNSRTKSPLSICNHSTHSQRSATVILNRRPSESITVISPEPSTSKISLTRTNLNPTEITKPDGSRELRFPNGNIKQISTDGKYSKFMYYNGDVKENFYNEGRIKYFYSETKTFHTTHADGLEVLEFPE